MVSFCSNLLVNFLIQTTYSSVKNPWGKMSCLVSDDVFNLASKRMMYLA